MPLAEHFAKKYARECGRKITGLAPAARAYLRSYSWPGNVRELENAIERAVVLGSADTILPEDLPEHIRESHPAEVSASLYEEAVEDAKRKVVLKAFEQSNYDHEIAAKILGLHPNYLHKLIRTMDLKAELKTPAAKAVTRLASRLLETSNYSVLNSGCPASAVRNPNNASASVTIIVKATSARVPDREIRVERKLVQENCDEKRHRHGQQSEPHQTVNTIRPKNRMLIGHPIHRIRLRWWRTCRPAQPPPRRPPATASAVTSEPEKSGTGFRAIC